MPHSYRFGNVEVLPVERQLLVDGRPEPVGSRAFDVLLALIEGRSRLVTKDQLFDTVWPGLVVGENNLQAQVSALRKVIGAQSIKTVAGLGYRFAATLHDDEPVRMNGKSHGLASSDGAILLDASTQRRIDPLSVFTGAFRLDAAERVLRECAADEALQGPAVTLLELPQVERVPTSPPRIRLPEELRLPGRDRLRAAGRMEAAGRAHGRAMAAIAHTGIEEFWASCDQAGWLATYRWDYNDFEVALERSCERHDASVGAAVGLVLQCLDLERDNSAVRTRKEALFGLLRYATDPEIRSLILHSLSMFRAIPIPQMSPLEAAIERESICRRARDSRAHYNALTRLANLYANDGNAEAMESALRSARSLLDPGWPPRFRWDAAAAESDGRLRLHDGTGALASTGEMIRVAAEMVDATATAHSNFFRACAVILAGDLPGGIALAERAARELQDQALWRMLSVCNCKLCGAYLRAGDLRAARATARHALARVSTVDAYILFDHLALLSVRMGRFHEAALLLGYGDAGRRWKARPGPDIGPQATWEAANAVQRALGPREHARLRRMGAEMSDEQIRAVANEAIAAEATP